MISMYCSIIGDGRAAASGGGSAASSGGRLRAASMRRTLADGGGGFTGEAGRLWTLWVWFKGSKRALVLRGGPPKRNGRGKAPAPLTSDTGKEGYFTSLRPVIFSRLPCMIALYLAFDRSRLSKIFSVSRM